MASKMRAAIAIESSLAERHADALRRWQAREAGLDLRYLIELRTRLSQARRDVQKLRFAGL